MKNKIEKHFEFCNELMERLVMSYKDNKDIESPWYRGMNNRTQIQGDIKRLRRELLKLCKELDGDTK